MDTMTKRIALAQLKRLRQMELEYERECEEYARQGYRPHYCIHGTNQWTDYDNICGPCEDGWTIYQGAIQYAYEYSAELERLHKLYREANELHLPSEVTDGIMDRIIAVWKRAGIA